MNRMNYEAVVIPVKYAPIAYYNYIPYIFSEKQLGDILKAIDQFCKNSQWIFYHLEFPIIYRLLIGCGLRISETLAIEKKDYDSEKQTIVLRETKNRVERIIPIADSIAKRINGYIIVTQGLRIFHDSNFLFPNPKGDSYSASTLYDFFRKRLWQAGIPHQGRGKGPRLHDLRHTYAVRTINKWVREGKNLTTCLPYLAIYMGHAGLKSSEHYLKLTTQMFPELLAKVNHYYSWVVPEVQSEE